MPRATVWTLTELGLFDMDAWGRLQGIKMCLEHVDEFLSHVQDQAFLRKRAELARLPAGSVDRDLCASELDLMTDEWSGRIPAYFRGSLIIMLWAEAEALIETFATHVKLKKGFALDFDEIKGSSTYSRLRKYVEVALDVRMTENCALEDLEFLRHIYAHTGGNLPSLKDGRRKRIDAICRRYPTASIDSEFLVLRTAFVYTMLEAVEALVRKLNTIHPCGQEYFIEGANNEC